MRQKYIKRKNIYIHIAFLLIIFVPLQGFYISRLWENLDYIILI